MNSTQAPRPVFVGAGEGIKASAEQTGGALGLVETVVPPGHSTPLHVHRDEDEAFYVLAGAVDLVCGGERFRAEAGAFAYMPRGIPHTFLGIGDDAPRLVGSCCRASSFVSLTTGRATGQSAYRRIAATGPPPEHQSAGTS